MAKKKESRKVAIEAVRTNRKRLLTNTYSKKQKNFLMQYGIYAKKPMSTVIIHYAHNHWPNSFIALKLMKNV